VIFKEALNAVNLVKPKNGRVHAKTKRTDFLERMMETGSVEDWLQKFRMTRLEK
jgi:hypothetical protein